MDNKYFMLCLKESVDFGLIPEYPNRLPAKHLQNILDVSNEYPITRADLVKKALDEWAADIACATA